MKEKHTRKVFFNTLPYKETESRVEGNLSLGPVGIPFRGTVRYRAE